MAATALADMNSQYNAYNYDDNIVINNNDEDNCNYDNDNSSGNNCNNIKSGS